MPYEDELDELLEEMSGEDDYYEDIGDGDDVVVGYDEIVGAEEIIGKRGRGRRGSLANRMRKARNIDPRAVALVKKRGGPRRRKVLAGTTTTVPLGATAIVEFEAQENFRPEEFFVQGSNIDDFLIESIKVGTEEQFVNSGSVPADVFGPNGLRSNVHFKTMNLGSTLVVVVRNTSAGDLAFNSAFIGTAVD